MDSTFGITRPSSPGRTTALASWMKRCEPTTFTRTKRAGVRYFGSSARRAATSSSAAPICTRAFSFALGPTPSSMYLMIASTGKDSALSIIRWRSPGTNIQERRSFVRSIIWAASLSASYRKLTPHPAREWRALRAARLPLPQGEREKLIGFRHAEHILAKESQHQIVIDGRGHIEPRLAEFAFHVIFAREAIAAIRVEAGVRCLPRRLAGQQLGHIRFGAAFLAAVEFLCRDIAHAGSRFDMGVAARQRNLHALIGADRLADHDALAGIFRAALDEPAAIPDGFGGDQDALGIPAVDDVAKALAFLADAVLDGNFHILEEQDVGVMVEHHVERLDVELSLDVAHIDKENRKALRLVLQLLVRRGARQKQHQVGLLGARDENLLAIHDIFVASARGAGL